ncbi:MAG TPA: cytidine deaminase [Bdellovibrionota bacterium]|nr:cytidine deaminase [Bdellovibrionota bacterium]
MSVPAQIPKSLHDLYEAAERARNNAYAPYSKYKVGAAIRTAGGRIFASGNLENVVNGASVCAERGAIQQIMSELGKVEPVEVLVLTGGPPAAPCGVCRQVLNEFAHQGELPIHSVSPKGEILSTTLRALFPHAFTPDRVSH